MADIEPLLLDRAVDPDVGDEVYVIGHPGGGPMQFASHDCEVVFIDPPYVGDHDRDDSNRGVLATLIAKDLAP